MLRKRSHFSEKSTIDALSGANERMSLQPKQQPEGGSDTNKNYHSQKQWLGLK